MTKKKNTVAYNSKTETLIVNGKDWGNLGMAGWVLERIAQRSERFGGLDFVITDDPIKYGEWQNFHAIDVYPDIPNEAVKNVLHEHNYRGGFTNQHWALVSSTKYGTDVPLINSLPLDIGEDALVFYFAYNHSNPNDEFQWTIVHLSQ